MSKRKSIFAMLLFVFALSVPTSAYHKYHSSLTLMDYNEKDKVIEITIQLFTHDLLPVLERKTGKSVDLEKTAGSEAALLTYLNENFILNQNGKSVGNLVWVGMETKVDRVIVYVEMPFDHAIENCELKNTIFFESVKTQTNLVTFNFGELTSNLVFSPKDQFKSIQFTRRAEN